MLPNINLFRGFFCDLVHANLSSLIFLFALYLVIHLTQTTFSTISYLLVVLQYHFLSLSCTCWFFWMKSEIHTIHQAILKTTQVAFSGMPSQFTDKINITSFAMSLHLTWHFYSGITIILLFWTLRFLILRNYLRLIISKYLS